MNKMQARGNLCKVMAAVVLALAVSFIATVAMGEHAYADSDDGAVLSAQDTSTLITAGDYEYRVYFDDKGVATSIWAIKYSGSDTQIVMPSSFQSSGKTYPLAGGAIDVDDSVFAGNKAIKKIALPSNVDGVSQNAFAGCAGLTEVAIGDSLTYLGPGAFSGCGNLKTYRINGSNVSSFLDAGGNINSSADPLIGHDASGNVYADVVVYTKKDSAIDKYIQKVNANSANGKTIRLVYEDNPFANHTVKPSATSGPGATTGGSGSTGGGSLAAGTSPDLSRQMGIDGTPYTKGASSVAVDKALVKYAKESDPKGSKFSLLKAKITKVTKNSVKLTWSKVRGAKKYVVYGNKCGTKNKLVKQKTTTKSALTFKKVTKKAVKKGTYYKFIVVALDKKGNVLSTSKVVHAATPGGKVGNDKKVTTAAKKNKVTIKVKKTFKLKAKAVPASKKLKVKRHRKVAFESDNPKVAKVSAKGVITGVKKGKCNVYAYAQNGVCTKIKVTVK